MHRGQIPVPRGPDTGTRSSVPSKWIPDTILKLLHILDIFAQSTLPLKHGKEKIN